MRTGPPSVATAASPQAVGEEPGWECSDLIAESGKRTGATSVATAAELGTAEKPPVFALRQGTLQRVRIRPQAGARRGTEFSRSVVKAKVPLGWQELFFLFSKRWSANRALSKFPCPQDDFGSRIARHWAQ